jgi:transcriptional regulator with XRE-family HTH domain
MSTPSASPDHVAMDDVRIGNTLRVIRVRKHLRQSDVARRAGTSRQLVGRIESGAAGRYPLDTIRAVANALGARFDGRLRYQGAELDRIINAAHAELHESIARYFGTLAGWIWLPEVTFSHYGERGTIDILAWHAKTRSLLIIELKTELADPQELVAVMNRRVRLGRVIAEQQGWDPVTISAWVIVRRSRTERRRLLRHEGILRRAFPADGRAMRRWLRAPTGAVSALSLWTDVTAGGLRPTIGATKRVRRPDSHP